MPSRMSATGSPTWRCRGCWTCYLASSRMARSSFHQALTWIFAGGIWIVSSTPHRQTSLASSEGIHPSSMFCLCFRLFIRSLLVRTVSLFSFLSGTHAGHIYRPLSFCFVRPLVACLRHAVSGVFPYIPMLSPFYCLLHFLLFGVDDSAVAVAVSAWGAWDCWIL